MYLQDIITQAQCHANPELYLARSKHKQKKNVALPSESWLQKTQGSCATDHNTTVRVAVDLNELPPSIGDTILNS